MAVAPDQAHRSSALLSHLARLIRMRSESELEPLGLRPRHLVALTVLRANGGVAGQQELASELQVDRTNLVGLLNELEAEGLILRRRAGADRGGGQGPPARAALRAAPEGGGGARARLLRCRGRTRAGVLRRAILFRS